jgi:hypothetical protein
LIPVFSVLIVTAIVVEILVLKRRGKFPFNKPPADEKYKFSSFIIFHSFYQFISTTIYDQNMSIDETIAVIEMLSMNSTKKFQDKNNRIKTIENENESFPRIDESFFV